MLQVINLQIGDGRVSCIHLMALGDHLLREILRPVVLVFFHLREGSPKIGVVPFALAVSQKRQGESEIPLLVFSSSRRSPLSR